MLLSAGARGKRYAATDARITLHAPWDLRPIDRQTNDVAGRLARVAALMTELLHRHTGQARDILARDVQAGRWMRAADARRYGLIDHVAPAPRTRSATVRSDPRRLREE